MYYYHSHLGGYVKSVKNLNFNELYCDTCGDYDVPLGYFETEEEFLKMLVVTKHYLAYDLRLIDEEEFEDE